MQVNVPASSLPIFLILSEPFLVTKTLALEAEEARPLRFSSAWCSIIALPLAQRILVLRENVVL